MSQWPATRARRVFAALLKIGWRHESTTDSHRIPKREGWSDYVFSFHDSSEIGPTMLSKIGKKTGLKPEDL